MRSFLKAWAILSLALFAITATALRARAEGRTVVGTISALDPDARTVSVIDGMGVRWNFKVAPDADIDLAGFQTGGRVSVTISRATPLNMMTSADVLRKGDRIVKIPY